MKRRTVLQGSLAAAALAGRFLTPADAQDSLIDVTYGTLGPSSGEWPVYLALDQGFFKSEGLNLSVANLGGPVNVVNAIATNAVTIAANGPDNVIAGISHGLGIKIVAMTFAVNPYSLIVPASIHSWADLKGQSVSLATSKDVTAISMMQMAAQSRLTLADFSIVQGGTSSARYAALMSGNVQGTILSQPYDLLALSQGMHALATARDAMPDWHFASYSVNTAWATANRATILKLLRATWRAIRYGYTHKDDAVRVLSAQTHVTPAIADQTYDLVFRKWRAFHDDMLFPDGSLEYIQKLQLQIGAISGAIPVAQVYDPTFLKDLS